MATFTEAEAFQQDGVDPPFQLPGIDNSLLELRELSNEVEQQLRLQAAHPDPLSASQSLSSLPTHQGSQQQQQQQPYPHSASSTRKKSLYRDPSSLPLQSTNSTSLTSTAADPLAKSARNPKLVGRSAPPYESATLAATQMARKMAPEPQNSETGSLLNLGGPGPLGSPLAKLMHKYSKSHTLINSDTTPEQDLTSRTKQKHAKQPISARKATNPTPPKWAQPRDAAATGATRQSQQFGGEGVAAKLAHTLPGQWQFREAQARALQDAATRPRGLVTGPGGAAFSFQKEMDGLNEEIDAFLSEDRFTRSAPGAAIVLQARWRARAPRLMFINYKRQRERACSATLHVYFDHLRLLAAAIRHWRQGLLASCFHEWLELGSLKMELYKKVLLRLKASMIDVRDSQSPSHLWRLCMVEGQDPWVAHISLGALCRNLIIGQAPRRKLVSYFNAWKEQLQFKNHTRQQAAAVLHRMRVRHDRGRLLMLFRFWFRWSVVRQSERMGLSPPLFRPPLMIWDAWLSNHNRGRHLQLHIPKLHRGFRVRHCFQFWHFFTARNKRMRLAWVSSAAHLIESILRQAVNSLKANWHEARHGRRLCMKHVVKEWARVAQRNVLVRIISAEVKLVSRKTSLKQCFRMLRVWACMSALLSTSACIQMWQRKTLCLIPMFAWSGDSVHMWLYSVWHAWRNLAIGRLRFRCLVGMHIERMGMLGQQRMLGLDMELWFRRWAKAVRAQVHLRSQVAKYHAKQSSKQHREAVNKQARLEQLQKSLDALQDEKEGSPGSSISPQASRASNLLSASLKQQMESGPNLTLAQGAIDTDIDSDSNEDMAWPLPGTRVCPVEEFELPDGCVPVNLSDFPAGSPYRPLPLQATLAKHTAPPPSKAHLSNLVKDLQRVEGRFKPGLVNKQQFVLEGIGGGPVPLDLNMKKFLSAGREESLAGWWVHQGPSKAGSPSGTRDSASPVDHRDSFLWQRLVGLMACRVQPHPEAPLRVLADSSVLPFAEEMGAMKRWQYRDRMRLPILEEEEDVGEEGSEAQAQALKARKRRMSYEFARNAKDGQWDGAEAWEGALCKGARELMWLYKLAEAEEVLETSVAWLMNLPGKDMPLLYEVLISQQTSAIGPTALGQLNQHVQAHPRPLSMQSSRPSSKQTTRPVSSNNTQTVSIALPERMSCCRQGDLLACLLRGAVKQDSHYFCMALSHMVNRDRVITTSSDLRTYAHALHRHCPEFTLIHPINGGMKTWEDVVARVDGEDSRPSSGPTENLPSNMQRSSSPDPESNGPKSRNVKSGRRRGSFEHVRGNISMSKQGPSKSDLIRMEMEGTLPAASSKLSTIVESKSQEGKHEESRPGHTARTKASSSPWGKACGAGIGNGNSTPPTEPNAGGRRHVSMVQQLPGSESSSRHMSPLPSGPASGPRRSNSSLPQPWRPTGVQKSNPSVNQHSSHKSRGPGSPLKMSSLAPVRSNEIQTSPSSIPSPHPQFGHQVPASSPIWNGTVQSWSNQGGLMNSSRDLKHEDAAYPLGARPTSITSDYTESGLLTPIGIHETLEGEASFDGQGGKKKQLQPYVWFAGPGRIFEGVSDVEVSPESASMHELHHRANRVADQDLANNLFAMPLMPAIVFQEWGDPRHESQPEQQGQAGGIVVAGEDDSRNVSPSSLPKKKSVAVKGAGSWDQEGKEALPPAQQLLQSQTSCMSTEPGASGPNLTEEQLRELGVLQDEAGMDSRLALRMVNQDSAFAPQRDVEGTNRLRQGMEGYVETRLLDTSCSSKSNPLTRMRMSGDGAGEDEYSKEEQQQLAAQIKQKQASKDVDASMLTAQPSYARPQPSDRAFTQEHLTFEKDALATQSGGSKGTTCWDGQGSEQHRREGPQSSAAEEKAQALQWAEGLSTHQQHERQRGVQDKGDAKGQIKEGSGAGDEEGSEEVSVDKQGSARGAIPEYKRRPPVKRPIFKVTAHQLNVFLGGHVGGGKRPNAITRDAIPGQQQKEVSPAQAAGAADTIPAESRGAEAGAPADQPSAKAEEAQLQERWSPIHGGSQAAFEAVFDPLRVVRSGSQRRAQLLDGYDLRHELRELLQEGQWDNGIRAGDGDYSALALTGAEAVLFGNRNLSAEEERAVRAELERLERELPKVPRQPPNLPVGVSPPISPPRKSHKSSPRGHSVSPGRSPPTLTVDISQPLSPRTSIMGTNPVSPTRSSPLLVEPEPSPLQQLQLLPEPAGNEPGIEAVSSFSKMMQHLKQQAARESEADHRLPNPLTSGSPPPAAAPSYAFPRGPSPIYLPPPLPISPGQEQLQQLHHKGQPRSTAVEDASIIFPERPSTMDSLTQSVYPESMASSGLAVAGLNDQYNKDDEAFKVKAWSSKGLDSAGSMECEAGGSKANQTTCGSPSDSNAAMGAMFARRASRQRACRHGNLRTIANAPPLPGLPPFAQSMQPKILQPPSGVVAGAVPAELPGVQGATAPPLAVAPVKRPGSAPERAPSPLESEAALQGTGIPQGLPVGMQAHGPLDLQGLLPGDEEATTAAAAEQEALREMWCAPSYSQQGEGSIGTAAAAMSSIMNHAAEDEWLQYEEGAMQLIEQLTAALVKHNVPDLPEGETDSKPVTWGTSHRATAPPKSVLPASTKRLSPAEAEGHSLMTAAATRANTHALMHGLDTLEQNVAAAIEPRALTGLNLEHYGEGLMDLMARLVLAPMATKYLFWKKVQSVGQLKQRVMEDRALEQQLQDIAWSSSFTTGHSPGPSGSVCPEQASKNEALKPHRSVGGPQALAPLTQGWSPGARSVLTTPKAAWMDEVSASTCMSKTAKPDGVMRSICTPLHLKPRDDTPTPRAGQVQRSKSARARAAAEFCESAPGLNLLQQQWRLPQQQQAGGGVSEPMLRPQPPAPMTITTLGKQGSQQQQQQPSEAQLRQQYFPAAGNEQLAERLVALLEARRGMARNKAPLDSLYIDVEALEQDEAEVERMASWTISLNKDKLAALHSKQGSLGQSCGMHPGLVPGKGAMLGSLHTEHKGGSWMHSGPSPKTAAHAYNGRDFHQDTKDPFLYPTRVRPPRAMPISAKGVRPAVVSASYADAPLVVTGLAGSRGHVSRPSQDPSSPSLSAPHTQAHAPSAASGKAVTHTRDWGGTAHNELGSQLENLGHPPSTGLTPHADNWRAAKVSIDPTSTVTVVAPLPHKAKAHLSQRTIDAGSQHLPSPSGQQRPTRGWHNTGGNAAPVGAVSALPLAPPSKPGPEALQQQIQQGMRQEGERPGSQQGSESHNLSQNNFATLQSSQQGHATSSSLGRNAESESKAIKGLEHCFLGGHGGPTPLGPGSVHRQGLWPHGHPVLKGGEKKPDGW